MTTKFVRENQAGVALWELVAGFTFFGLLFFTAQTKVSSHWRRELKALQEERLPYTGRRPR